MTSVENLLSDDPPTKAVAEGSEEAVGLNWNEPGRASMYARKSSSEQRSI
jgi:hypothetical protein